MTIEKRSRGRPNVKGIGRIVSQHTHRSETFGFKAFAAKIFMVRGHEVTRSTVFPKLNDDSWHNQVKRLNEWCADYDRLSSLGSNSLTADKKRLRPKGAGSESS